MKIHVTVNGTVHESDVEPRTLLVHYVREALGLTGTNVGCDTSSCGACSLHLNGESVKSCTVLAVQADGADILTIEGLAQNGEMHPMQTGVHGEPRPAVRVLHARHGDGGDEPAQREPAPDRARSPPRARRQPVPLHRLSQHRPGRLACAAGN